MCMPSTNSKQTSSVLYPSSTNSKQTSLVLYPSYYSSFIFTFSATAPSKTADNENLKTNRTCSSRANKRWGMGLCASLLSVLLITVRNIDQSSFHNRTSVSCSSSANHNGSDSCSAATIDSEARDIPSNTHNRGKVVGTNVKAADLATAYHSIKSEYSALASNGQWQLMSSHTDGSEVSILHHPADPSCPYVHMTAIMPGTVKDVWNFLELENWETSMPKIDPYYDGLTVFGDYKHRGLEMKLAKKKTKRLFTFGKRDFTFLSVSENLHNGAWVSGTVSVVADQLPKEKGYVRAYQDSMSYYESMENDDKTGEPRMKLTMMFRLDLNDSRSGGDGGKVPMWVYVKTAGRTAMASVQNMKRQLELHAKEKGNIENNEKPCHNNWLQRIQNGTKKC